MMVASNYIHYIWCMILFFCVRGADGTCNVPALYECFNGDVAQNITFGGSKTDAENCRFYQYFGKCIEPYSSYCYGVPDWDGILDEYVLMINRYCYPSKPCNMTVVNHCTQTILDPVIAGIASNDLSEFRPHCKSTLENYNNCIDNADQHCMFSSEYYDTKEKMKDINLVCDSLPECDLYRIKSCTKSVKQLFRSVTTILLSTEEQNRLCSGATEYFSCIGDMFTSCATSGFAVPMTEQADFYMAHATYLFFDLTCRQYQKDLTSLATGCLNYFGSPFFSGEKSSVDKCNQIPLKTDSNQNPLHCRTISLYLDCLAVPLIKICDYTQVLTFIKYIGSLRRQTTDIFFKTTCEVDFQAATTVSPPPVPPVVTSAPDGCDLKKMVDCSSSLKSVTMDMILWYLPKSQHITDVCSQSTQTLSCLNPLMTACQIQLMTMPFDALIEYMQIHGLVIQVDHICNKFYDGLSGNAKYCNDKVNETVNQSLQKCNVPPLGSTDQCESIKIMVYNCAHQYLKDVCDTESLPVVLDFLSTLQRNIVDTFQGTTCQKDYEASLPTTTTSKPVRITTTPLPTTRTTTLPSTVPTSPQAQNVGLTPPGSINGCVVYHLPVVYVCFVLLLTNIFV